MHFDRVAPCQSPGPLRLSFLSSFFPEALRRRLAPRGCCWGKQNLLILGHWFESPCAWGRPGFILICTSLGSQNPVNWDQNCPSHHRPSVPPVPKPQPVASPASGEEEEEGAETFLPPPGPPWRPALPPLSQMVSAAPCQASKILPMGSSPSFPAASLPGSAPFSLNLLFVPEAPPQRLWGSLCPFPFGEQIPQPPGAWQFGLKLVPFEDLLPLLSRR